MAEYCNHMGMTWSYPVSIAPLGIKHALWPRPLGRVLVAATGRVGNDRGDGSEHPPDVLEQVSDTPLVDHVRSERLRDAAGLADLADDGLGSARPRRVVDRHRPPIGGETMGDGRAQAARGAGHHRNARGTHPTSVRVTRRASYAAERRTWRG